MKTIEPIAYIKTDFKEKFGIPRQSGKSPTAKGTIIFNEKYRNIDALKGIDEFSHLWLIFDFSAAHMNEWSPTVRPPRLGGNKRIGVFATRSPFRPNSLGLSSVKFESLYKDNKYGYVLEVSGVDLLDGTPIYDIKPYLAYTDSHPEATGSYADQNLSHKLDVKFTKNCDDILDIEIKTTLIECLSDDPRPSYIDNSDRVYRMNFSDFNVSFKVENNVLTVLEIDEAKK